MKKQTKPKRIAFIHIPKTAGTYIFTYLKVLLEDEGYSVKNSWKFEKRDYTKGELLKFMKKDKKLLVHNHLKNWDEETIKEYRKNGWFIFTFIRHPGDRLCSEYYYFNKGETGITLNDFIMKNIEQPNPDCEIPKYYKSINYINIFTEYNIKSFLSTYFKHKYHPKIPLMESQNKGYKYYCKSGEIDETTRELLKTTREYKIYQKIISESTKDKKVALINFGTSPGNNLFPILAPLFIKEGYNIRNSWSIEKRDYTDEELEDISNEERPTFIHNHYYSWSKKTIQKYNEKEWITCAFINHPGDKVCEEYYKKGISEKWGITLNQYIKSNIINQKPINQKIKDYYKSIKYLRINNNKNVTEFIQKYVNKGYRGNISLKKRGYEFYYNQGLISKETDDLLESSPQYKIYKKIKNKTIKSKLIDLRKKIKTRIKEYNLAIKEKIATKDNIVNRLIERYPIKSNMMTKEQLKNILTQLMVVLDNNIEGDIVEMGCHNGETTLFMQRMLNFYKSKKKIYVYDSFQGLPKKEEQDKNNNEPNKSIHLGSLQTTKRNLLINFKQAKLKLPIIHKGWFKEVPSELFPKKIAFAFFDGDLYNSILESFKKTYTKVETGGIIVIDDYNSELFPGVKRATEDFLKGREIVDEIENQGIIIKK